jgi:predicted Zn-dependent protease
MSTRRSVRLLLAPAVATLLATDVAARALVSVAQEIEIGRQAQADARSKVPALRDRQTNDYVSALGRALARRAGGPKYPYTFSVANYREVNAFALPGGPVWLHRGAIEFATNESQLAGVLAHEIAHIASRHAANRLTKSLVANGMLGLLGAMLGNDGGARAARIGAGVGTGFIFMKFSRDDEREADRVGAQIMSRAGYDPRGMIEFLQRLRAQQGRNPSSVEVFMSTHPAPGDRATTLQPVVLQLRPGRRDSGTFQNVRRRLQRMPPAERMPRG